MNVSDPLWKTKHKAPASGATSTPTQVDKFITIYNSLALHRSWKFSPIANDSSTDGLGLSQSQTNALIAAISTSGPHLFTFPTFLIVAFTVTFMTIILPLIAGTIFRILLQSVDHYKGHWRTLVLILTIATIVLTRKFIPFDLQYIYIFIFGFPQGTFALFILYRTECGQKRWIAYAGILSASIVYDAVSFQDGSYEAVSLRDGHTFNAPLFLGLTGILPLLYLFIMGLAADITVFMRTQSPYWKNKLNFNIPSAFTTHQKEWIWVLAAIWIGFKVGLYFAVKLAQEILFLYIAGYSVVLGCYSIERFVASRRANEGLNKWAFYLVTVGCSTFLDTFFTQGLLLSTMPFLWLIGFRFWQNDQAFITRYFPKWMNFRRQQSHPVLRPEEPV